MSRATGEVDEFLPLRPQDLEVLLVLDRGPLHAYGIARASEGDRGGVRLEIGSLYRMVNRLLSAGLLEEVDDERSARDDGEGASRRRTFGITTLGRRVLGAEVERLRRVVDTARRQRILADGGES